MNKKNTYTVKITDYPHQEIEVDKETGEVIRMTEKVTERSLEVPVLESYQDVKLPKKFKFNNGNFITIFQKELANIALFGDLSKEEYRMLLYLIGTCGPSNSICIDLVQLSEQLGMKKSNVSRALKGLVQRNIVIRSDGYRYGKNPLPFKLELRFDQINYNLASTCKIKNYKEHKTEHPMLMKADGETPLLKSDRQMLSQVDAANRQIIDLVNGEEEDPRQMHLDFNEE